MSQKFLPTEYQSIIHLSRYARWNQEKNKRETFDDTVNRYFEFFLNREYNNKITKQDIDKINTVVKDDVFNLNVMPSMRALMTSGSALARDNVAGYNCAYVAVDHPRVFDETMYVLMCGTGVGFSCERQYVNKLPEVPETFHKSDSTIVVRDSKIGWASAYRELLSMLWAGQIPNWDISRIRPAGSRLKTFGGRASGPEPLVDLFEFTVSTFKNTAGRKFSSIDVHDLMCKIADIVVVGGVRRSALISLSNLSDDRMRNAKTGQWWNDNPQRALSNNSVAYTEKPDFEVFLQEWKSLCESKSGERGIFNRVAAKKTVEKIGRRDSEHEWGCNPCCFTGEMKLLTEDGYKPFKELVGEEVQVINKDGSTTDGTVWSSGVKDIVSVNFESRLGRNPILCTPDHRFMLTDGSECQAENLTGKQPMPFIDIKDSFDKEEFLAGFVLGDGALNRMNSDAHKGLEVYFSKKDSDIAEMYEQEIGPWYSTHAKEIAEQFNLPAEKIGNRGLPTKGLLSGLYSANGSVIKNGRIALKSTDHKQLLSVQEELNSFGIESYITTNKAKKNVFSNGEYEMKESYDLNIARYDSILLFAKHVSFGQKYKRDALREMLIRRAPKVRSVKSFGKKEVFDFTEPETHWGVVENCVVHNSEIILRPSQFCNLTETVIRSNDTYEDLKKKVESATILGTLQASLTDFRYLRNIWKRNTEEEALLGVSFTGIMDHPFMSGKVKKHKDFEGMTLPEVLENLKQHAIEVNKEWSEKIGINQSAAITCVKPSGTVSQLVDSASGIHPRYSKYYIRRIRADVKDPLAQFMIQQGFPYEQDHNKPQVLVFDFPIEAPSSAIMRDDVGAMEQLKLWKIYQDHWCEHKPSITVYYTDNDFLEVGNWVWNNFDDISGISFLPHSNHSYKQAPYEETDKETYVELCNKMPANVDWEALSLLEEEDNTTGSQEFACKGNTCELSEV